MRQSGHPDEAVGRADSYKKLHLNSAGNSWCLRAGEKGASVVRPDALQIPDGIIKIQMEFVAFFFECLIKHDMDPFYIIYSEIS